MNDSQRPAVLRINPRDNVCVALRPLSAGETAAFADGAVQVKQDVPLGAKLALTDLAVGEKIIKMGEPIGSTTAPVAAGEHVHTHNIKSDYIATRARAASQGAQTKAIP